MCTVAYTGEKLAKFVDQYKHCHQVKINREKRLAAEYALLEQTNRDPVLINRYTHFAMLVPIQLVPGPHCPSHNCTFSGTGLTLI